MPHGIVGGENKVKTMLIVAVNITAQKIFIDHFLSYSVELNCMLTEGVRLDRKRTSLCNEIRKLLTAS